MKGFLLSLLLALSLTYSQAKSSNKHFLWKVTDQDSEIWLLGSIHMVPKGFYPLPKEMENAFLASSEIAVELNISSDTTMMQVAQAMMLEGMYRKGDALDKHIGSKTMARLDSFYLANKIPREGMTSLKPWLLAIRMGTALIGNAGAEAEQGIDLHYITRAEQTKKPIVALETAAQQLALFQSLPDSLQEVMLEWTMDEAENMTTLLDSLFQIWKQGDVMAMEKFVLQDQAKDPRFASFFKKLYYDRNLKMAAHAEAFLKKNRKVLVVVGCAHLVGVEGVPELLRKTGYKVEQR